MSKIKITQVRSRIDRPEKHKRILDALGLHKMNASRIHEDVDSIRGMVKKIPHLVTVEPVKNGQE